MMMLMFHFMFISMPTIPMRGFVSMFKSLFMSMSISVMGDKNLVKPKENVSIIPVHP